MVLFCVYVGLVIAIKVAIIHNAMDHVAIGLAQRTVEVIGFPSTVSKAPIGLVAIPAIDSRDIVANSFNRRKEFVLLWSRVGMLRGPTM